MKKQTACLLIIVFALIFSACSGGGAGGDGGGGGGGGTVTGTTIQDQLTSAKDLLTNGDVKGALNVYNTVIGSAASASTIKGANAQKDTSTDNAEARFGRALCNIILLVETTPFTTLLGAFGQQPWTASNIFGANGYFAMSLTDPMAAKQLMPFYGVRDCWELKQKRCILSRAQSGFTSEDLASELEGLTSSIDTIISDLLVAIQTQSASYTIPKGLYSGDIDIPINHSDMVQILAGMYGAKAGMDFANSWTFNFDLSTLVDANGHGLLTKQQVLDKLNAQFGLRSDNRLVSARANSQEAIDYTKQALGEVLNGANNGVLNLTTANKPIIQELYDMIGSARSTFDGDAAIVDISPTITANMDKFFNNPPDDNAIGSDPFVLSSSKHIRPVEVYWQQAISSACNFKLGTKGVKVFSAAVRQISRPYYQLFNTIMGHTFGRHRAGKGA